MSEQEQTKGSYMQELDQWTQSRVIDPLLYAGAKSVEDEQEGVVDSTEYEVVSEMVKKAIREKTLDSYRNGLRAGARRENHTPREHFRPRQFSRQKEAQR